MSRPTSDSLESAFNGGIEAYEFGLKENANCYEPNSEAWKAWRRGYISAFNSANPDLVEFSMTSDPAKQVFDKASIWSKEAADKFWKE